MIADRLRISEHNLNLRKSLIGLGPEDIRALAQLRTWVRSAVVPLIKDLLDWQLQHEGVDFGLNFFENRLQIGRTHNAINLPPKWYLSSCAVYDWLFRCHLRQGILYFRPWFRRKAEIAFTKVMNYDSQAVADAYLLGLIDELRFDSACVPPLPLTHDLTDGLKHLMTFMMHATDHMRRTHSELDQVGSVIGKLLPPSPT